MGTAPRDDWSVIVPTRAGWPNLQRSLPAIAAALGGGGEILMVADNVRLDSEAERSLHFRAIAHVGERGFATACNAGAREARGRWLLFVNDDVEFEPTTVESLERILDDPGIAAAGPNVWSERLGRSESGTRLEWRRGVLDTRQEALPESGFWDVPFLTGAAIAVRRDEFLRIGGFDERLAPYYWEDVDLCLRLRAGRRLVVVGDAIVHHRHGVTIGMEDPRARRIVYERNRLLVTWRHAGGQRMAVHLAWLPARLGASCLRDRVVARAWLEALRRRGRRPDARS
jgi:GT2 family glycosyltransferase